jgi:hypothetical protein
MAEPPVEIKYHDQQESLPKQGSPAKHQRGRVLNSGVDVLNGLSDMAHLSNSLVGRPLQNYGAAAYLPSRINVNPSLGGNKSQDARHTLDSREHSNSAGGNRLGSGSQLGAEVTYDPFYTNQQRYLAHQKAAVNKQNQIYSQHMNSFTMPE